MTNRTNTRGWGASMRCFGAAASVTIAVLLGTCGTAVAQTSEAVAPAQTAQPQMRASEVGHATRSWLDLQSSNTQAAPALPMLGAEAGLAYHRYMESFKSKIPDLYGSALNTGNGGSGAMSVNSGIGSSGGSSN
jgi:hypothetical protein